MGESRSGLDVLPKNEEEFIWKLLAFFTFPTHFWHLLLKIMDAVYNLYFASLYPVMKFCINKNDLKSCTRKVRTTVAVRITLWDHFRDTILCTETVLLRFGFTYQKAWMESFMWWMKSLAGMSDWPHLMGTTLANKSVLKEKWRAGKSSIFFLKPIFKHWSFISWVFSLDHMRYSVLTLHIVYNSRNCKIVLREK